EPVRLPRTRGPNLPEAHWRLFVPATTLLARRLSQVQRVVSGGGHRLVRIPLHGPDWRISMGPAFGGWSASTHISGRSGGFPRSRAGREAWCIRRIAQRGGGA